MNQRARRHFRRCAGAKKQSLRYCAVDDQARQTCRHGSSPSRRPSSAIRSVYIEVRRMCACDCAQRNAPCSTLDRAVRKTHQDWPRRLLRRDQPIRSRRETTCGLFTSCEGRPPGRAPHIIDCCGSGRGTGREQLSTTGNANTTACDPTGSRTTISTTTAHLQSRQRGNAVVVARSR